MKLIIKLTFLLLPLNLLAGDCSKSEQLEDFDSPIAYMEDNSLSEDFGLGEYLERELGEKYQIAKEYFKQLNQFLRKNNDLSVQLSAIEDIFNSVTIDERKRILKKAINKNSDKHSLFLAASACNSDKKLQKWCHKRKIHQVHQKVDPENVYSYLLAMHANTDVGNNELLQIAADNSQHANSFFHENTLEIAALMDEFNQLNPDLFHQYMSIGDEELDDFNNEIQSMQLVEKGLIKKNIDFKSENISSIIHVTGMAMARVMTFSPISKSCNHVENANSCLQLGMLLSTSDTLTSKMLGFSLIQQAYELLDYDISEINQISDISKKELGIIACYSNSNDLMYAKILNKDLMIQFINDAQQFGESKAYKNLAFSVYKTVKQHGFNPDFNPNDC